MINGLGDLAVDRYALESVGYLLYEGLGIVYLHVAPVDHGILHEDLQSVLYVYGAGCCLHPTKGRVLSRSGPEYMFKASFKLGVLQFLKALVRVLEVYLMCKDKDVVTRRGDPALESVNR